MMSSTLPFVLATFPLVIVAWIGAAIHISKHFYFKKEDHDRPTIAKELRFFLMSFLIFNIIAHILAFSLKALALSGHTYYYDYAPGYKHFIISICIMMLFGYISFFIFLFIRLYSTFEATNFYNIKFSSIIFYAILVIITAILFCIYAISYFLLKTQLLIKYSPLIITIAVTGVILNIFVSLSLCILFAKGLLQLVLLKRKSLLKEWGVTLSPRQRRLVHIVTKHCVLTMIAIFMFNIGIPICISVYVWILPHTKWTFLSTMLATFICHAIEMLCIVLGFTFNKKSYLCCCQCCHFGLEFCCHKFAMRQLNNAKNDEPAMRFNSAMNDPMPAVTERQLSTL